MSEVSYRVLPSLLDALSRAGVDTEELLDELPISRSDAQRIRGGFEWSTFAELVRRSVRSVGGVAGFEAVVYEASRTPPLPSIVPLARALVRPRDICWMGARWLGPSLFRIIKNEFEDLPDGRVRQSLEIPPEYEDLPEFFYAMRATMRAAPHLVGLESADVEMHTSHRRADYWLTFPARSKTRRAALRAGGQENLELEVIKSIEEMGAQLDELQVTQAALREANQRLEERVRERSQELLESRARLAESQRMVSLGTLAAGIAHEINNPLAAIQATAQLAQVARARAPGPSPDEPSDRTLEIVISEAQRCSRIVRGLLQFARDEPTEKWSVGSDGIADRSIEMVRRDADEAGVALDVELADMPAEKPLNVFGNPIQLEQLLVNVLRNAIQATPPGGRVTLQTGSYGEYVRFTITDAGRGIQATDLPRIFEPFFTTRLQDGGTGLGLSMAHGIAEEHGGRLLVESRLGEGTCVHADIPLHRPD